MISIESRVIDVAAGTSSTRLILENTTVFSAPIVQLVASNITLAVSNINYISDGVWDVIWDRSVPATAAVRINIVYKKAK